MATPKERLLKLGVRKAAEEFFAGKKHSPAELKAFVSRRLGIIKRAHARGARGLAVCRDRKSVV